MFEDYKTILTGAKRITVLTGAGVSTDSGIPDFRSSDATWKYDEPREVLISLPYFLQEPASFWSVYREVFGSKFDAEPNSIHRWIASLEDHAKVTVITQNVDGLHQAAGSTQVLEAHGSLRTAECLRCGRKYHMDKLHDQTVPMCAHCNAPLKPSVSLFMEGVHHMGESRDSILESDVFLCIGTSLQVGPVNELPFVAIYATEQPTIWLNREPAPEHYDFSHSVLGELSGFVKAIC
jgi:NAD-dependent deacetylase